MKQTRENNWLMIGIGLGSTLLLGMTSCDDNEAVGIQLAAGNAGTEANGGSDVGSGGSGDAGVAGTDEFGGSGGEAEASAGSAGSKAPGKGGSGGSSNAHAGSHSDAEGGNHSDNGGEAGAPASGAGGTGGSGGTGGTEIGGTGGDTAGMGGTGGDTAGTGGTGGEGPLAACIFQSGPAPASGGEGGGTAAPGGVEVTTNTFLGPHLTDLAGMTLYIYGADVPGDCNNAPVTNCTADCAIAWPPFNAKERTLDETLDPAVFGTLDRGDGTFQTTYFGWPLYYYKSDAAPAAIGGQGKGKTWYAAEVALPNLMIMRGSVAAGGIKYLSDDRGYTLYALSGDTLGGSGTSPVSACTGSCLDAFLPYAPGAVYPVTAIEPHDVDLFFRDGGGLQTAYKGAPLYYSRADVRPGEQNGLTVFGGALVLP